MHREVNRGRGPACNRRLIGAKGRADTIGSTSGWGAGRTGNGVGSGHRGPRTYRGAVRGDRATARSGGVPCGLSQGTAARSRMRGKARRGGPGGAEGGALAARGGRGGGRPAPVRPA